MAPPRVVFLAAILLCAVSARADSAAPVEVVRPVPAETAEELRLTGTVTAKRHARLSPRVSGLVEEVLVDAGDRAAKGDVLLQLDRDLADLELRATGASLQEARARLAEAKRLHREALQLVTEQHIPETEVHSREAAAKREEATVERLRAEVQAQAERVERHSVVAPFDGFVSRRLTEAGEWVETGTAVLELVSIDRLRLDVQAPQERFSQIDENTSVAVRLDGLQGETFSGRVIAKVPVNDPTARTFLVRVEVEDTGGRMIPGMSAEAEFGIAGKQEALLIPRDAIVRAPDGTHRVWTVERSDGESRAVQRKVRIGRSLRESVEVLEGLDGRPPVVVRGNETLRDGQRVRPIGDGAS